MQRPCSLKHSLGVPGVGVHKHIFGVAWRDIVATLVVSAVIAGLDREKDFYRGTVAWFLRLFIAGQILHWFFCVDTEFIKLLRY